MVIKDALDADGFPPLARGLQAERLRKGVLFRPGASRRGRSTELKFMGYQRPSRAPKR